jgi:hypothetical protein
MITNSKLYAILKTKTTKYTNTNEKTSVILDNVFNKTNINYTNNLNISPTPTNLINGFFLPNKNYAEYGNLTAHRNLTIPSAASIINEIPNCSNGTSFQFIVNNCQEGNFNRIVLRGINIIIDDTAYNGNDYIEINQGFSYTFLAVVNNITPGEESVTIYTINKSFIA